MKKVKLFFVTVTMLLSGCAASHSNVNSVDGRPKTRKDVEAALKNYSISYILDVVGQTSNCFYQARCEQGWAFRTENEWGGYFLVVDEEEGKVYKLNDQEKTGELYPFDPVYAYRGFDLPHLLFHESVKLINNRDFKKTGDSDTIAGRPTTVYTYQYKNGNGTFWIDNQYGFLLKYIQTGANEMQVEVTEFIVGDITLADMVDLDEYCIVEVNPNAEE